MPSDSDAIAARPGALSFAPLLYATTYLHPGRIDDAFERLLGGVDMYTLRSEQTTGGEVGWNWVLSIKGKADRSGGEDITFNLQKPLVRALVLRAYLERERRVDLDIRSARALSHVLARGRGSFAYPAKEGGPRNSLDNLLPRDVATEIQVERDARNIKRYDDHHPEYWTLYCNTPNGLGVAFLGLRELLDPSTTVSLSGQPLNWCIFGTKIKDGPSGWTLLNPFHAWQEPSDT